MSVLQRIQKEIQSYLQWQEKISNKKSFICADYQYAHKYDAFIYNN
jgi:hypothetical protein